MTSGFKKFIILLIVAVVITALMLARQLSIFNKVSVEKSERPLIEPTSVMIPLDINDPLLGNQGAPMTIVEFVDINSTESRQAHQKLAKFIEEHPTEIRLIFKDYPDKGFFSSSNYRPHYAAFCAQKQDSKKFWPYLNELMKYRKGFNEEKTLLAVAEVVKLNTTTLKICLDSSEAKARIESAVSLAEALGLKKAPEIFVNNRKVNYLTEVDIDAFLTELIKKY
ncbi:MAG: thioredoxin domain-containing protein [Candidatus Magasanikbacteria bacterium]|nr:thioredoxin domain-containing protein [Candidatus Magasanikbacteria bacterium]